MNGLKLLELRKKNNLTQEKLAEKLDVSFQAVSSWERNESEPDLKNLLKLSEIFNVSVNYFFNDFQFETIDRVFDEEKMYTFVKTKASILKLSNTLNALEFAREKHKDQKRKNCDVPYLNHLLTVCCHALALGIQDDALLSACLLHDCIEDCNVTKEQLPVCDEAKELVGLLTHGEKSDTQAMDEYYQKIKKNPKAVLIKCLDRCNNNSTMVWGFNRNKLVQYIEETEKDILPLLEILKSTPEYSNAYWLLKYQMYSLLDSIKRMI